jgi:tRNA A-37 threonylcarbamoyl transferase component Bud32
MFLICPKCALELEFSNRPPRFCSNCGAPIDSQATLAYTHISTASDTPDVIGGYRLLKLIGSGGMGSVYEAQDANGRHVAMKLIRPEFLDSPEAVERFRREGRLASTVIHPRCVFVLAADEEKGRPYIVMELMPGRNLNDLVTAGGPLPVAEAVRHTLDVIEGLQEAHAGGMIHRDVKPSNCFLDADGRVKVGDFGLAKTLTGQEQLTRTGAFLGTFLYASPEQIRNDKVDHLTDIYSVCATLYFLLTGKAPFDDQDPAAALAKTVSDPLISMRRHRKDVPTTLDEVVLKGLARNRKQRWQSLEELRLALLPFVEGPHSLAEVAARAGAYAVDLVAFGPFAFLLHLTAAWFVTGPLRLLAPAVADWFGPLGTESSLTSLLLTVMAGTLYFGIPESIWGCTPGKWLLRLRVRDATGGDRPSLLRAMLRAAVFFLIVEGTVEAGTGVLHGLGVTNPRFATSTGMLIGVAGLGVMLPGSWLLGLGLIASTMRRANGYRGLHELVSGTRTIRLPSGRARFVMPAKQEWPTHTAPPAGLPGRLGTFRVVGVARSGPGEAVLYGADTSLERPVWLWLHGGDELPVKRREVARMTRPRWLAGGEHGGRRWEAFVASSGCLLADLMAGRKRLNWTDALTLLEQLTDELMASEQEETLPPTLSLEQVWVLPTGRVMLLDAAPRAPVAVGSPLGLLRQVAVLTLEGTSRPVEQGPVRAPVPAHARAVLNRLMSEEGFLSLSEVKRSLESVKDLPDEISWPGRAMQAGLCGLMCLPGLALMFLVGPALLALALLVTAVGRAQTSESHEALGEPEASRRWKELGRQQDTLLEGVLWIARPGMAKVAESTQQNAREQFRAMQQGEMPEDDVLVTDSDDLTDGAAPFAQEALGAWWWPVLGMLGFPLLWAAGSWLTRGGFSLWLVGIRLLDGQGQRAARWRCAWRTLLVWLPIGLLLTASLLIDLWRAAHGGDFDRPTIWSAWLSQACWWGALALLPLYAAIAVLRPNRGPHDRLAGTWPVP